MQNYEFRTQTCSAYQYSFLSPLIICIFLIDAVVYRDEMIHTATFTAIQTPSASNGYANGSIVSNENIIYIAIFDKSVNKTVKTLRYINKYSEDMTDSAVRSDKDAPRERRAA